MKSSTKITRFWSASVRKITALVLCSVMMIGLFPQIVSAISVPAQQAVETAAVPAEKSTAALSKVAFPISADAYLAGTRSSPYSYSHAIVPDGSGTIKEDWNKDTKVLKLTATPYPGSTFECWTELYYDEEAGEDRERLITDSDPYNPVLTYVVQPYVARVIIANFRVAGKYFIYDNTKFSTKGRLSVSPEQDCFLPGQTVTVTATPNSGYRVAFLQYGINTDDMMSAAGVDWQTFSTSNTGSFTMPASDVWIRGLYYSTTPHNVTVSSVGHGTTTFSNGATSTQAAEGDQLTLVITPEPGFMIQSIAGAPSNYDLRTNTFTMINSDVDIQVTFVVSNEYSLHIEADPPTLGQFAYARNQETGVIGLGAIPNNTSIIFLGWYDGEGKLVTADQIFTFIQTEDVELYARFVQGYHVYIATNLKHGSLSIYPEKDFFAPGEKVKLLGMPEDGYMLKALGVADVINGSVGSVSVIDGDTITIGENDVAVTAMFTKVYDIKATANDKDAGFAIGSSLYEEYDAATLTAVPNEGYEFVNWTENGSEVSRSTEYSFYVTSDRTIVANFRKLVNVTVSSSNDAYGTASGGTTVSPGTSVTVSASPKTDCVFVNWTKNGSEVSKSTSYTFNANEDTELVANFRQLNNYTVTATSSNPNYGTTSGSGSYKEGSSATVTATPKTDCVFVNWTKNGTEVSKSASYTFTPDSNVELVANFKEIPKYTVTAQSADTSMGTVSGSGTYKEGTSVTVTATPKTDCFFVNWTKGGKTVSESASYTFTAEADVTLVANFSKVVHYSVTATASNDAYGTVTGSGSYKEGTSVTVTATANEDCYFINWTKDGAVVSESASYTFTPDADVTLVANFGAEAKYTVTAIPSNEEYGTASGSGTYKAGTSVTVNAAANSGYTFVNWTAGGNVVSTSASYTFTVDSDVELTANFAESAGTEFVPGDINGDNDVNNKDVVALFRYCSGAEAEVNVIALDPNGDGEVNNKDIVALFRFVSGGGDALSDKPYTPPAE